MYIYTYIFIKYWVMIFKLMFFLCSYMNILSCKYKFLSYSFNWKHFCFQKQKTHVAVPLHERRLSLGCTKTSSKGRSWQWSKKRSCRHRIFKCRTNLTNDIIFFPEWHMDWWNWEPMIFSSIWGTENSYSVLGLSLFKQRNRWL